MIYDFMTEMVALQRGWLFLPMGCGIAIGWVLFHKRKAGD
jgi:hypothetical protein